MVQVFTTPQVIHRLNECEAEGRGYLFGIPDSEDGPIILEFSLQSKQEEEEDDQQDVSNPFLPTGMDPIGVFIVTESDEALLDEIEALISGLSEDFLAVHDPVVFIRRKKGTPVEAFINSSLLDSASLSISEDYSDRILQVRVRGLLQLICSADEEDITKSFRDLLNKVTCPYGCFRLDNSRVLFLHLWKEGASKSLQGWSVKSSEFFAKEEDDEEQCIVTGVDDFQKRKMVELWDYVEAKEEDSDEDDGFIPAGHVMKKKKKKTVAKTQQGEFMNFKLLLNMSGEAYTRRTYNCSPVVREDTRVKKCFKINLPIDAIGIMNKKTKMVDGMNILKGCVQRQIHLMGTVVLSEFRSFKTVSQPEAFHFKTKELGNHMVTMVYTKSLPCSSLGHVRKKIHEEFMLPLNRPLFRRSNRYIIDTDMPKSGPLINPHENIKPPGLGKTYLVQGKYAYHHYMQNGFNDDGWGCAYRSLQTLISWFRLQGYTGTEIPTHAQIQKCLVEIGDKERSFIDSKQWIGSTEVGFVLDTALHVQSKFVSVSSGEEMPMKARDLAHHFETNGTPVMIGGGVLAHTILGVDWNEDTGDVKWLILDPHYTGSDWKDGKPNLSVITGKGWCGWKGPEFWVKDAFYNMCMPIRPTQW